MRGIVLEAAVRGRVVGGRDDDAVALLCALVASVPLEDGVGHAGRGGEGLVLGDAGLDMVGCQYLQGGAVGRLGQGVGVEADEERALEAFFGAVFADRLGDGRDVVLVEGPPDGASAVA